MQVQQGVQLHFIKTSKFKDIGISVRFRNTLEAKSAPARSLLALMLCDRSRKYDTKKKMSAYLDMLYGASLNAQTAGYGNAQIMEVRAKLINPSYVEDGARVLEEVCMFLHEIIFEPLLEEDVFQESKAILLAKIERNEDEPAQYAISRGLKLAGKGTPLGLSALGEKEVVEALSLQDIKDSYHRMIHEDVIDIIICGDVAEESTGNFIQTALPFAARDTIVKTFYKVQSQAQDERVEEYKNISQSNIMMVWFTNASIQEEAYYPLRVANAVLGQYSTSMLFQEVREKNSLCYSIFSNLISFDGAMGVTTGVEKDNIDKTIDLIKKQVTRIIDGDFDEALVKVSQQMIVNSLKASKDNMNSLIALQYQNNLLNKNYQTEDIIEKVMAVTKEDVIQVMRQCELKLTFVLTQGGDSHEEDNK